MSGHPLDRPVWSALTTRQAHLAQGDRRARRFPSAIGPFGAAADHSPENLAALAALIATDGGLAIAEPDEVALPPGTEVVMRAVGHQMIAEHVPPPDPSFEALPLGEADAPDMMALATLTKPGPFALRTRELGDFFGIRRQGRLVAMAGERMKLPGFTEISGVCTHPDNRGHGHAGALMRLVAARIFARGETPFLHVFASNAGAISLYESLGFAYRRALTLTVLARE